jgi:hypothetical protein
MPTAAIPVRLGTGSRLKEKQVIQKIKSSIPNIRRIPEDIKLNKKVDGKRKKKMSNGSGEKRGGSDPSKPITPNITPQKKAMNNSTPAILSRAFALSSFVKLYFPPRGAQFL